METYFNKKILLVDDEKEIIDLIEEVLINKIIGKERLYEQVWGVYSSICDNTLRYIYDI